MQYTELNLAQEDGILRTRVRVACMVAADIIRAELASVPNHVNRLLWAKSVYEDPNRAGDSMIWGVLAQNRSATLAQVAAVTDAQIQTAVNLQVDVFATGL